MQPDRSFVDDDRQQILARIALVEEAPAAKRNLQRRKVSRADDAETRSLNRLEVRGTPLRVDRRAEAAAVERHRIGERGAGDTRDPFERGDEPLMLNAAGRVGLGGWGGDLERQQVIGIEAGRDAAEIEQVRDEDGGRRQQA